MPPKTRSFDFTLNNRHNVPVMRFVLLSETTNEAVGCGSDWGEYFRHFYISDD
jgi:hypothetical protein